MFIRSCPNITIKSPQIKVKRISEIYCLKLILSIILSLAGATLEALINWINFREPQKSFWNIIHTRLNCTFREMFILLLLLAKKTASTNSCCLNCIFFLRQPLKIRFYHFLSLTHLRAFKNVT